MASQKLCACDPTRESLIGKKLNFIDTVHLPFSVLVRSLSNVPQSGLWMNHFRGIPRGPHLSRFDVIYLDESARVLACVENFTEAEFEPLGQEVASAIILPAHALASLNVLAGDQLRICRAGRVLAGEDLSIGEEPQRCLRDATPRGADLRLLGGEEFPSTNAADSGFGIRNQKLSFKQRVLLWFFPEAADADRRHGKRLPARNLVAYYWTGGAPQAYKLADVSASGLYLFTEERWLPGTRLVMTLQRGSDASSNGEDISRVESEVVRWGEDGVAFRFVESGFVDLNTGEIVEGKKFDRQALEQFLRQVSGSEDL